MRSRCNFVRALPVETATIEQRDIDGATEEQKINPKLEQALTRGDLTIRQANSGRATAVLRALGKMDRRGIGVEAFVEIHDSDKIYNPADGVWPQQLLISLDGSVEENDSDEICTVSLLADTPSTIFRCEW